MYRHEANSLSATHAMMRGIVGLAAPCLPRDGP
jgi:hypothetical protein